VARRINLLVLLVACFLLEPSTAARLRAASPTPAKVRCELTRAAGQAVTTTTGAVSGKVTDSTGAALPGVTITISSEAVIGNRGTRSAVTSADGLYRFPALPPGEYSLLFTLEGFRAVRREGRPRRPWFHSDSRCRSEHRRAKPERDRRTEITCH
jgi:Carboxypeptidase regulatory-like domain